MEKSNIEWTDYTWNIAVGCTKVDEDCKYCYMYRESLNGTRYEPKVVRKTKTVFNLPLKIKEPSKIFVSSLTDVFHEDCDSFRAEVWEIIRKCPQHTFQILTKRPERILDNLPEDFSKESYRNVIFGTSVGSQDGIERLTNLINAMFKTGFKIFLSVEPLHGFVDLSTPYFHWRIIRNVRHEFRTKLVDLLDWVIVGGESGNESGQYRYRPCELAWIESIVNQCKEAKVPVFVKQLGTHLAKELKLSDRHGKNIDEFPSHLQIREFPRLSN